MTPTSDVFLMKTDVGGVPEWTRVSITLSEDEGQDVRTMPDGG
ncbi:MAG: hypothetical protein U0610_06575 [bacterium]